MTTNDITAMTAELHPSLLRFVMDLNDEELAYFRQQARIQYESMHVDTSSGKIRAIRSLPTLEEPKPSRNREQREIAGVKKLFSEYNNLSALTDKQCAEVVKDELWAFQSIYSRESAMLENIIDRLMRSNGGLVKPTSPEDLTAMIEALA
jgi:hypothetical protein